MYYMYAVYILYVKCPLGMQKYDGEGKRERERREREAEREKKRVILSSAHFTVLQPSKICIKSTALHKLIKSLFTVWYEGGAQQYKSLSAGAFLPYCSK